MSRFMSYYHVSREEEHNLPAFTSPSSHTTLHYYTLHFTDIHLPITYTPYALAGTQLRRSVKS
jgi:hypothetical protein